MAENHGLLRVMGTASFTPSARYVAIDNIPYATTVVIKSISDKYPVDVEFKDLDANTFYIIDMKVPNMTIYLKAKNASDNTAFSTTQFNVRW